jgi:hypothetical protein
MKIVRPEVIGKEQLFVFKSNELNASVGISGFESPLSYQ